MGVYFGEYYILFIYECYGRFFGGGGFELSFEGK